MRSAPLLLAFALLACSSESDSKEGRSGPCDPREPEAATNEAPKAATNEAPKPTTDAPSDLAARPEPSGPILAGPILEHTVKLLDGTDKSLADYRGKALLVVNTASECGFTPQYADLQQLYAKLGARGLEVLAFPSNDFGGQEPGSPEEIRQFVDGKYHVEFEMFDKVAIKGADKAALYQTLTEQTPEGIKGEVKWNFTKFLVDPQGRVVARFEPDVSPNSPEVIAAIEAVLPKA